MGDVTDAGGHSARLRQNATAQQAGLVASMARAHEKMLREIYYQKLQRGQVRKMQAENQDLKRQVENLKQTRRPISQSQSAQQAGLVASMARSHEKMLRDIYYQKLQRGRNQRTEHQLVQLREEVASLRQENEKLRAGGAGGGGGRRNVASSNAAQQAGILASMAKAHEKMLREIYYQKLQRGRNKKAEGELEKLRAEVQSARLALGAGAGPEKTELEQQLRRMRDENDTLQHLYEQSKKLAEAGLDHRGVTEEVIEENRRLQLHVQELERRMEGQGGAEGASPPAEDIGEMQLLRSRTKRLEIENMKLERRVHELAGGGPSSPPVPLLPLPPGPDAGPVVGGRSSPVEGRVVELEQRVRELEVLSSPRAREGMTPDQANPRTRLASTSPHGRTAAAGFTVRVACDVHGVKHNVRLSFYQQPTMAALVNAVDTCYDVAARSSHPPGCPDVPFTLAALQVFDSAQQRWVDLTEGLLANTVDPQLFCFQHASVWHPDRPGTIPVAETVDTWLTLPSGPKRSVAVTAPPPRSVMVVTVFKEVLGASDQYFQYADFRNSLLRFGLELTGMTVGELFAQVDKRRDGVVTRDEWVDHCKENPHFIETLYFKAADAKNEQPHVPSQFAQSPAASHHFRSPSHRERMASRMEAESDTRHGFSHY